MNKQQVLDIEQPTPEQWVLQQLLMSTSYTRLKEIDRCTKEILKKLFKTYAKNMPYEQVCNMIKLAIKLANDETLEDEKTTKTTQDQPSVVE